VKGHRKVKGLFHNSEFSKRKGGVIKGKRAGTGLPGGLSQKKGNHPLPEGNGKKNVPYEIRIAVRLKVE